MGIDKNYFFELSDFLLKRLGPKDHVTLEFKGENSYFYRLNQGKIRQSGEIADFRLNIRLIQENQDGLLRKGEAGLSLTQNFREDCHQGDSVLKALQNEISNLPVDPYLEIARFDHQSDSEKIQKYSPSKDVVEAIISSNQEHFLPTGAYTSGDIFCGLASSAGARHWFGVSSWNLDYSLYGSQERAYKGFCSGYEEDPSEWNWEQERKNASDRLQALEHPYFKIERGEYPVYLAPEAVYDLLFFLKSIFGESDRRQGSSPLRLVKEGERAFSPLLGFGDDFRSGVVPRFSEEGELQPEYRKLISEGRIVGTLIGPRSAKKYDLVSNTSNSEWVNSGTLESSTGFLTESNILEELGTGLYLSNLHYLNWSDRPKGRITGMTRYACFWVEGGKLVAPIQNMRWDDTIFRLFGSELKGTTKVSQSFPYIGTYGSRKAGSNRCPGMLLNSMAFTL